MQVNTDTRRFVFVSFKYDGRETSIEKQRFTVTAKSITILPEIHREIFVKFAGG